MNKPEIIILDTSDEAASIKTVTGWVSRTGRFWGDDERMARYDGSAHKVCACGAMISQKSYCRLCADRRQLEKYEAMERKPWDGESMLYSDGSDEYFSDMSEVHDRCAENDINVADLRLIICEPNYASQIDPSEHYCDDVPEDGEVPAGIAAAFDALNKAIRECGTPLSWSPGKYALDLELLGQEAA